MAACSEPLRGVRSSELAGAMALRRAVSLVREEGFTDVLFKSDCLSVVQRLTSLSKDRSVVGSVLVDVKSLANGLSCVAFHHVRRHCNVVAHVLSRSSLGSSSLSISRYALDCIRETLCKFVA